MNKRKLGKILMIAGIVSICAFCMVFLGLDLARIKLPQEATLGIGALMLVVSLPMICVGEWMFRERGRVSANKRKYSQLPYREISDYKAELDGMRANFAADMSSDKNRITKSPFKSAAAYFDFSVIGTGKIYYGYLVEANNQLFTPQRNNSYDVLPAVFVYSTDEHFDEHPYDLQPIAEKLFADRQNNILRNEREYFYNVKVDKTITEGREVYMTTVMVSRAHLPLGYLSSSLVPLIADPLRSTSVFVVDVRYWTETLGCNLANASNVKKILQSAMDAYDNYPVVEIENYAYELAAVREKFLENLEEEEVGEEEPFGELGKESKQEKYSFYYAYVLHVDKKLNDPFNRENLFPAIVLYSDDEDYKTDPRELAKTAAFINGLSEEERKENFKQAVDVKTHSIRDISVPIEWTEGRRAYLSGVLILRENMPKRCVTGYIMPVIRLNASGLLYSIDKEYWTEGLISQFVHANTEL